MTNVEARMTNAGKSSVWARVRMFGELIRFSHTIFALPFALLSAAMAYDVFLFTIAISDSEWGHQMRAAVDDGMLYRKMATDAVGILLCMVFARSAAMAFNRVVDWKFDAENPRTVKRHIPAGLMSRGSVIGWTVICAIGFVASTALFLPNKWPLILSVPFLAFICGYSLTKRFTSLAHFWLGASLMLAPISAWIAVLGDLALGHSVCPLFFFGEATFESPVLKFLAFDVPWPPLVLGGAVLLWVAGFDIIYSTQDIDVDRKLRLRSVPARFGVAGALRIAALCHLGTIGLLFLVPSVFPAFGMIWYGGVALVAVLLVYEHALVRPDDLSRVNAAFFNCNAVVSLGLLAVGIADLLV